MRQLLALIVITALTAGSALAATDQATAMKTCSNKWHTKSDAEMGSTTREDFMFKCMQGGAAAASGSSALAAIRPGAGGSIATKPAASGSIAIKADASGSAKCKDGATVTYKRRRGTCLGHGGVKSWL
jgi:hypothetical protein